MQFLQNNKLSVRRQVPMEQLVYARVPDMIVEHIKRDMLVSLALAMKPKVEYVDAPSDPRDMVETYHMETYVLSPTEMRCLMRNYNDMKNFLAGQVAGGNYVAKIVLDQVKGREDQCFKESSMVKE